MRYSKIAKSIFFKLSAVILIAESIYILLHYDLNPITVAGSVGCIGLASGSYLYSIQDNDIAQNLVGNIQDYGSINQHA